MVLKEFYQSKDYQQYPESEFVRNNPKVAHILGASKPHEQLVFSQYSKWWHSIKESKLHIKNLLAYNAGVVFSFGNSHYQIDLNFDLMKQILSDEVKTPYLQFRIYSSEKQVTIKNIVVKINDSEEITLNPISGIYRNVDYDAKTLLEIDNGYLTVTRMKDEFPLFFDLIFHVPEYNKLQLLTFQYSGEIKMLIYNSPVTAIIHSGTEDKMIQVDQTFLNSKSRESYLALMLDPGAYMNTGVFYDSKKSSNHLGLYLDMKFYDPHPDPDYTAVRAIQLILEPVEKTFVKFYQRKYHDLVSLGTFHKMNENLFLLFKNSVVMPAFTEYTIYDNEIHLPARMQFLNDHPDILDNIDSYDLEASDYLGPYDLGYLHDVYQYEYPYGLELYRKDFDYFDYGVEINYQSDELLYVEYEIYDRDSVVIDQNFDTLQSGVIKLGDQIITEIEYPAIIYKFRQPIKLITRSKILFDHKHRAKINSKELSIIHFNNISVIPHYIYNSQIIFDHSHTKE